MSGAAAGRTAAAVPDREPATLLERFAAAYSGSEPAEAALRRALEPDVLDPRDADTVWGREEALRRRLYRPGATAEDAAEHRRLASATATEDGRVQDALAAARRAVPPPVVPDPAHPAAIPAPATAVRRPSRRRSLVLVAAATALVAVVVAVVAGGRDGPSALPERPVAIGRTIPLRGTPEQVERLRRAIHGATEGPDALITTTAIHDVAVLRDATRLSENDVTGTGSASLTVPDMDAFHRQRTATVLLFCATPAAWTWTLTGTVGSGRTARAWRQRGRGSDCGRLAVATVPLPPDLHETTLTARAEHGARLIAMLETVG